MHTRRNRCGRRLASAVAAAGLAAAVHTSEAGGQERRMLSAEEAPAFRAVGRLNVAGSRFCTATLIAERVIVTAAHCFFHPRSRARVPLSELRFVAGLRLGEAVAVRRVVRAVHDPAFVYRGEADLAGVSADLALAELDAPVPAAEAPAFRPGAIDPRAPLAIVSYRRDRPEAPSIEDRCRVEAMDARMAVLDCRVTFGVSGGPVLQGVGAAARLVGVVSAMARTVRDGAPATLATIVAPRIEALSAALAAAPSEAPR